MVEFLGACASAPPPPPRSPDLPRFDEAAAAILDLGCGNGSLLLALHDAGWAGRLLGVDYSEASVALAERVALARAAGRGVGGDGDGDGDGLEPPPGRLAEFLVWDVLAGPLDGVLAGEQARGWDIVLDKGTFDAVSLSGDRDGAGRRACELYRGRVLELVKTGGVFLVTSCNWTERELRAWFEGEGGEDGEEGEEGEEGAWEGGLKQVGRVEYPTFSFGGVKGQAISTMCFMKVES
jgi:SAM-dependent methyltransferase